MGKKSKYPSYSGGSITVNGNTVSTSSKNKNTINSSYNMSDTEKSIYNGIQSNLNSTLADLFNFSDEKQKQFNSELEAYKNSGIKQINEIYDPMVTNLTNNIASRFGNLDNSIFMDNLSTITDNKAEAVADLSESINQKQSELYSAEMANRLSYISLLNSLNSTMNNNILNYMSAARSNSESGNNYNQQAYQAQNSGSNWLSTLGQVAQIGGNVMSFLNPTAGSALKTSGNAAKTAGS